MTLTFVLLSRRQAFDLDLGRLGRSVDHEVAVLVGRDEAFHHLQGGGDIRYAGCRCF